jgi:hypothetical protein
MLELSLPTEADNLDLDALTSGGSFDFDSDAMLQFESLVDDMSANGLVEVTIADRNNVILMSMDRRDIGMLAPALEQPGETAATSERAMENGGSMPAHRYATRQVQSLALCG